MKRTLRFGFVRPPLDALHKFKPAFDERSPSEVRYEVINRFTKPVECLALGYGSAVVRARGHEAVHLDAMLMDWTEEETVSQILCGDVDVIAITVVLQHVPETLIRICEALRSRGFAGLVLVGGHSASFMAERILERIPAIDGVCRGEGELCLQAIAIALETGGDWRTAPGVVCRVSGGAFQSQRPKHIESLDEGVNPDRDLVVETIKRDGLIAISTSRGCNSRCSFCSVPRFQGLTQGTPMAAGGWRARSVGHVVQEVLALHERFGLLELLVVDDEFFGGTSAGIERGRLLGEELAACRIPLKFAMSCRAENVHADVLSQLQRGGLTHVFVGIENGVQSSLKLYAKGHSVAQNVKAIQTIKALGLTFQAGYMMFNYATSLRDLKQNIEFLLDVGELKPNIVNTHTDPHFGTPLVRGMERAGVLRDGGLSMTVEFLDSRVGIAKAAGEMCAKAFEPYMNVLARLQSAVSYEWRRIVPGRTDSAKRLLAALEERINRTFVSIFVDVVDVLNSGGESNAQVVADMVTGRLTEARREADLLTGLTVAKLRQEEGQLRYWSQLDLMEERRHPSAPASTHASLS